MELVTEYKDDMTKFIAGCVQSLQRTNLSGCSPDVRSRYGGTRTSDFPRVGVQCSHSERTGSIRSNRL
jgi:hypothetical protein